MTIRLAWRSLSARPVRSAVLSCGFGFGIAVMAALLGVGEVILEQSRAPALRGGGDVLVSGAHSRLTSARFVTTSVLGREPLVSRVRSVAPSARGTLYLVQEGSTVPVYVRAGVPSLDRARNDPEIAQVAAWLDPPSASRWTRPDAGDVLRSLDRFHPIPSPSAWEGSWAEWLYFNGASVNGQWRFYLTFFAGPRLPDGKRAAGVRLQLERDGVVRTYSRSAQVDESELLAGAPDIDIAGNRVRLEGLEYRIALDLDAEAKAGRSSASRGSARSETVRGDLTGNLVLRAAPGRSVPPFELRGAKGWVSGYTVPVLSGELSGALRSGDAETLTLAGATGYHDHNWGFWKGVTWQWGQVARDDLSIVYGRVRPPEDAADPERVPGFLAVLGPDGPLGFSTQVTIREGGEVADERRSVHSGMGIETMDNTIGEAPRRIFIEATGPGLEARLDAVVQSSVRSKLPGPFGAGDGQALAFVQMRAQFRVRGRAGKRTFDFTAAGATETFQAW